MKDPVTEHLEHYGVKGMKWGVRRKVGKSGRVSGSVDFRTTKDLRKRQAHQLSNMQLKKVNERMNLERKFSEMNPTRSTKGKKFVNEVMKNATGAAGTAAVVKLATDPKTRKAVSKGAAAIGKKLVKINYSGKWA